VWLGVPIKKFRLLSLITMHLGPRSLRLRAWSTSATCFSPRQLAVPNLVSLCQTGWVCQKVQNFAAQLGPRPLGWRRDRPEKPSPPNCIIVPNFVVLS